MYTSRDRHVMLFSSIFPIRRLVFSGICRVFGVILFEVSSVFVVMSLINYTFSMFHSFKACLWSVYNNNFRI